MNKKLVLSLIIIAAGAAVFLISRLGDKEEEGVLTLSGNIEVTEADIGFPFAGRIRELLKQEGEQVNKGERIASLDTSGIESEAEHARALLQENLAKVDELKAGARPQELEQARSQLDLARAEFSKAQKDHERAEKLYSNGAISAQQMDEAKKTLEISASLKRKAEETLSLVKEGPRKENVRAAEKRVEQARAALKSAEARLSDGTALAPAPGVVLAKHAEPGETVSAGSPVYTIGDLEKPWVRVYVHENRLGVVKLGQKAEVMTDSYPGKTYEGTVTYISSEAEFTPKNVQTREERVKLVFGVKVSVININNELKPGMPADVRIFTE
jgi:HlyD family secretion protein